MGKRAQQLACNECGHRWWQWFDNKFRHELLKWAHNETCPECDSGAWRLTDATRFAGGPVHTTDETCPECTYNASVSVVLRCGAGHEYIAREDADPTADVAAAVADADLGAVPAACPDCEALIEPFHDYCWRCGADCTDVTGDQSAGKTPDREAW